jgi:hypothetical protein
MSNSIDMIKPFTIPWHEQLDVNDFWCSFVLERMKSPDDVENGIRYLEGSFYYDNVRFPSGLTPPLFDEERKEMVASTGSCRCGAVSLSIDMKPFLTYNCHCSHCRAFASKFEGRELPYHGGAAVWKWNVAIRGDDKIEYEQTSSLGGLFSMSRGRCSNCHQPIWESGERAILPLAMVMAEPFLPGIKPNVDLFYDSGAKIRPTASRVLYTDLGSLLYEIYLVLFVAIPMLPWSLFKRLTRPADPFAGYVGKKET